MGRRHVCAGVRSRGHWKGCPCGAVPMVIDQIGMSWCRNHVPTGLVVRELTKAKRNAKTDDDS